MEEAYVMVYILLGTHRSLSPNRVSKEDDRKMNLCTAIPPLCRRTAVPCTLVPAQSTVRITH